ncbi:23S rRNA (adenine(2503)-C(2))-methyltransferase RlmN [Desulfohalovibrio reitneri]|uniref:23S rRNA (adenine(2503)-C(2))-methyltransferase RlmN n=1 Tax=Desulfohalovibrio reitneri TaxID=1307759 RepID=UPI0004A72C9D|nr:23S rRNA (adenine(2503)-C(2))-methyltransferase RlmN [Desulfohalovibrio reitneri]
MENILDLPFEALRERFTEMGEPAFRAEQVWQWLWRKRARSFGEMTNVSKGLRAGLESMFEIAWPVPENVPVSSDGTTKFLLRLADGQAVEMVLIPERDHYTLCMSSQVGCAMGCVFCSTGRMGFVRNLAHGEMLGQVLVAQDHIERNGLAMPLKNLVFMGMGEPLLNFETLLDGLRSMARDNGLGFGRRRVTVSTAGVPDRIRQLGETNLARLAVSLHAPTQELRERIMPKAAKALPLDRLMEDIRAYPLPQRERVTLEYTLLRGVNDSDEHARQLVRLLSTTKCKVNLIACNPGPDSPYDAPPSERVLAFEQVLRSKHLTTILRKSKGQDINAACGQLVAAHEM